MRVDSPAPLPLRYQNGCRLPERKGTDGITAGTMIARPVALFLPDATVEKDKDGR
jgi:hypothetical protein